MIPASPVFRFAPSPNGFLHAGHAYSALLNHDLARQSGGAFLLRIEDIDRARCTRAFEQAIEEDLAWLGLVWPKPPRRQSDHIADYEAALATLAARDLLYPCFCGRGEIRQAVAGRFGWPRDPDGSPLYPGTCRHLSADERARRLARGDAHSLRLDMDRARALVPGALAWDEVAANWSVRVVPAEPAKWGDVVLARKDIGTSYHLSVVIDDALQGVTHVVRGRDLFEATHLHRLLQALLDCPVPRWRHHDLIRDALGEKLAKTRGSVPIRELRLLGTTPAMLRAQVGLAPAPA
jgi:glutamyl-Q tRNA(Asp) synthetase